MDDSSSRRRHKKEDDNHDARLKRGRVMEEEDYYHVSRHKRRRDDYYYSWRRKQQTTKEDDNVNLLCSRRRLPEEIVIYNILTRVPLKSLIRFRSVCKQWKDLIIKDPLFTDLHSRRRYYQPGILFEHPFSKFNLAFRDIETKKKRTIWSCSHRRKNNDLIINNYERIKVLYSLHGLLLLSCEDDDRIAKTTMQEPVYFVFNPITGVSMKLPELILPEQVSIHFINNHFSLAYDSITRKYKVVVFLGENHEHGKYLCKIFTLDGIEGDSNYLWRDVPVQKLPHNHFIDFVYEPAGPVFANGSLHWIDRNCNDNIFSFDVSRETFYTIKLPKCSGRYYWRRVLEMGGLLCFVDRISRTRFELWVLEEEDEDFENEWTKKCNIDMDHLREEDKICLNNCTLLAILPHPKSIKLIFCTLPSGYGSDMGVYFPYQYYAYDTRRKQFDFICKQIGVYYRFGCHWHVNSLVNPLLTLESS